MNLFVFKYLEIENYSDLVNELKSQIDLEGIKQSKYKFTLLDVPKILSKCKLLSNYLNNQGLHPVKIAVLKFLPWDSGICHIHVDNCNAKTHDELKMNYVNNNQITRDLLALQIGLENVENSYTVLYKYLEGEIIQQNVINSNRPLINFPSLNFKNAKMQEIDRYVADRPVLFNVTVPHTVINPTDFIRLLLTIRFDPDPWHLTH